MPQKRNPISSEIMLAAAKAVRQHVAMFLDATVHDFERATGPWHVEWIALSESFQLSAASLKNAKFMLGGLVVREDRMKENLGLTNGLIVAEAVMMRLAPILGRQRAHDLVYEICKQAIDQDTSLAEGLLKAPEAVEAAGGENAIRELCDPANYVGLTSQMIDRVLRQFRREPEA